MEDQILTDQQAETEAETLKEEEVVNTLTEYFRRTGRGRIVELPRWAQ